MPSVSDIDGRPVLRGLYLFCVLATLLRRADAKQVSFLTTLERVLRPANLVSFPDVPGVIAVADTLDEALAEASVALGFAFEDWQGERPRQRTIDALREDAEFREWSADAVVAAVAPASGMAEAA